MKNIRNFYYKNRTILKLRQMYGSVARFMSDPIMWREELNRQKQLAHLLYRNRNIKNIFKGKDCFILGNGHSLNRMNLKRLQGKQVFVVNNFIVHPDLDIIKPSFYVNIEPFSLLTKKSKTNYFHPDNYYKLIDKKLNQHDTMLFFSSDSKDYIETNNLFKNKQVFYLATKCGIFDAQKYGYEADIIKPITFNDSVVISAICIASYAGFNPVYIIGCDEDAFKLRRVKHFYSTPAGKMLSDSQEELNREHEHDLKRWQLVANYFYRTDTSIYNAGIDGYLEAFPRIQYNEALKANA